MQLKGISRRKAVVNVNKAYRKMLALSNTIFVGADGKELERVTAHQQQKAMREHLLALAELTKLELNGVTK